MKSWKGWSGFGVRQYADAIKTKKDDTPVIVIDASKFPTDTPEIDSEWLSACDYTQTLLVKGPPIFCTASDKWLVPVENDGSKVLFLIQIADLHPIPKTAKGEVVGTVEKDALRKALDDLLDTYSVNGVPLVDEPNNIARTICTTLGITREMAHTLIPPRRDHGGKAQARRDASDIFTALLDLAEGDT